MRFLLVIGIALAVQFAGIAFASTIHDGIVALNRSSIVAHELPDWFQWIVKPRIENIGGTPVPLAPVGIASYGIMEVGGRYFAYELTTNAVKGVVDIPPNISVSGYLEWWQNIARYYGRTFSVQLNAYVVARLADGTMQYYWAQNVIIYGYYKGLRVKNNIWNTTDGTLALNGFAIRGNGGILIGIYVYEAFDTIPFGRVELEVWARADDGKIIIEFYANGQKYDKVIITPYVPATSAYIVIAPTTTPVGLPLNLELVLGGPNGFVPWAILHDGRIGLELYVRANDSWTPPPSAWSIGIATYERSCARVVPKDVGSVVVEPGAPNLQQLWPATAMSSALNVDALADNNAESIGTYAGGCPTRPPLIDEWGFLIYFIMTPVLSIIVYATISSIIKRLR